MTPHVRPATEADLPALGMLFDQYSRTLDQVGAVPLAVPPAPTTRRRGTAIVHLAKPAWLDATGGCRRGLGRARFRGSGAYTRTKSRRPQRDKTQEAATAMPLPDKDHRGMEEAAFEQCVSEGRLNGVFNGFRNHSTLFKFQGGAVWRQDEYFYRYYYLSSPKARILRILTKEDRRELFYIDVDGAERCVLVKPAYV